MTGDESTPRSAPRPRAGLVVVDDAQNRADAVALQRSGQALAAGRVEEAIIALRALAATPTTTVRAHAATILATLLVERGSAAEALVILEAIPPRGVTVDRGLIAMVRAQALRRIGRHADAVGAAAEAWQASPSTERCLVFAAALLADGQAGRAATILLEGLGAAPDDVALLGQCAGTLALAGDIAAARATLARLARRRADDDAEWQRQWAWASTCLGDVTASQAALDRAFALDPAGTRAWCADDDVLAARGVKVQECGDGPA
jgi:tetratricopeptide (TPR) repeat protein